MIDTFTQRIKTVLLGGVLMMALSMHGIGQDQVSTNPPLVANNGSAGITFNVSSNVPVVIDTLWCSFYGATPLTAAVWYNTTAINGAPNISSGSGWVALPTTTLTPTNTAFAGAPIQQIPIAINVPLPANATYGFFIGTTGGNVAYTTFVTGAPTTFTDGTVTIETGANVGYGGTAPSPTFSVRQYNGKVVYSLQTVDQYPYCEHFDDDDGGWIPTGISSSWEHGEPIGTFISSANSGLNAWVTNLDGDHNNNEFSYVFSPEFDLSSLIDPMFKASVIHELQSTDGVSLQVSTDSLVTWSTIGSSTSPAPWYNSNSVSSLIFFGDQNGWTGTQSTWTDMIHSLSALTNDTAVFFRFAFGADGSIANEGFGFDDIVVAESNDLNLVTLIAPDSVCGNSSTEVQAVICNRSIQPLSNFSIVLDTGGANITTNYVGSLPVCGCDTVALLNFNSSAGGDWDLNAYVQNTGDVNSANDSASTDMFIYEIPSGNVFSGTANYCEGELASIVFVMSGTQPFNLGFSDGTTSTFSPNLNSDTFEFVTTVGGNYQIVSLTDASGCPADTAGLTGSALVVFNPAPPLNLGSDTTVCGTYPLDAGAGLISYTWNSGATTQVLDASQSGTYSVTITDANGCSNTDQIELVVNILPVVGLVDAVICEGENYTFNAGAPYLSYLWDDGSTGQLLSVTTVTSVSVTVTDFNMCQGVGAASITAIVPNPTPSVSNLSGLAPLTLDAGSGYSAYSWVTSDTNQTIQVFASGTYTVTVTDANGCRGITSGNANIWPTGVKEVVLNADGISVFPNPAKDQVTIAITRENLAVAQLEVLDMNGRVVSGAMLKRSAEGLFEWSIPSHLTSGQYLIRIADASGNEVGNHSLLIQ